MNIDKPPYMDDMPGTRQARGKRKLCLVVGQECTYPGSYDPPEPPEYWRPVMYVVARTKKEAIKYAVQHPEEAEEYGGYGMQKYIDECRGEGCNPMWLLWCQYLMVIPDGMTDWDEIFDLLSQEDEKRLDEQFGPL